MIQTPQIVIDTQFNGLDQNHLSGSYSKSNRSMTSKAQRRIRNKIQERRNPYEQSKEEHKDSHASSSGFPKRKSNRVETSNKIQKVRVQSNVQKKELTVIEKTLRLFTPKATKMIELVNLKKSKRPVSNMIRKYSKTKSCRISAKHSESANDANNKLKSELLNNRSQKVITRNNENKITFDFSGNLKDTSYLASTIYRRNNDDPAKQGTNNDSFLMVQSKSQNESNKLSKRVLISKQK